MCIRDRHISLFKFKFVKKNMKNIFTILAVFFFTFSFSQEIKLNKSATKFEKDGVTYKLSEYKTQFTNLVAKDYISNGRSSRTLANIFGFGGGLLIGAGLPNALSSNKDSVSILSLIHI